MKRVTGLGGVFFKSRDVKKLKEWYRDHLNFPVTDYGASFVWGDLNPDKKGPGRTEWSPFKHDTDYFGPGTFSYMFNYRVDDIDALLQQLRTEGVSVPDKTEDTDYGRFTWIQDPEGRKIELWQPVDEGFGDAPAPWTGRVTGIGGVFFKTNDTAATKQWYEKHLGVSEMSFQWKDLANPSTKSPGMTVWSVFKKESDYFAPSDKDFMFNYRVSDLKNLLKDLRAEGVTVIDKFDEYDFGKFGWIVDLEGTKVELWEPVDHD